MTEDRTPDFDGIRAAQTGHPVRVVRRGTAHAPMIDVVEAGGVGEDDTGGGDIVIPRAVLVDGRAMWTPAGTLVKVEVEPGGSATTVTLSFLARGVRIGFAEDLGIDLDAVTEPPPPAVVEAARALLAAADAVPVDRLGNDDAYGLAAARARLRDALSHR